MKHAKEKGTYYNYSFTNSTQSKFHPKHVIINEDFMKYIIVFLVITVSAIGQTNRLVYLPKENNRTVNLFPIENSDVSSEKSVALAGLYSFLLPGMGELYVGSYSSGKYFTAAEGLLWVTLIGFQSYGTWVRNDARDFAAQHAGISIYGKSDQYFVDIGDYQTVRDYNDDMLRKRNLVKLIGEAYPTGWNWDSKSNREHYRDLRVASDQAFNSVSFTIAAIGVNHLVSAINAVLIARSHNKNLEQASTIDLKARVLGDIKNPHGIMFSFSKTF